MIASLLEKICKVHRPPEALLRIQSAHGAIDGELDTRRDAVIFVDAESRRTDKHLVAVCSGKLNAAALQEACAFAGELAKNPPVPAGIRSPRTRPVGVCDAIKKKVRPAVGLRFGVTLVARPDPKIIAAGDKAGDDANERPDAGVDLSKNSSHLLRPRDQDAADYCTLETGTDTGVTPVKPPDRKTL